MKISLLPCFVSIATAFRPPPVPRALSAPLPVATSHVSSAAAHALPGPSPELLSLFNSQVTNEFYASQLYLSASIWFEQREWNGFASFMLAESHEERGHALQFVDFANKRSIPLSLESVPAPVSQWSGPEDVWADILELEKTNTRSIIRLAGAASACDDFAVLAFLNPFHLEQIDSESKIGAILAKVVDERQTPGLLRQLDHELGTEAAGGEGP